MRTWKKFLAGFLAAVILAPSLVVPAQAAAPSVTTDESMYVNLDHYGKVEQVNVVKRVDLNGNSQFTDYGSYEKVTNMSNLTEPSVSSQGVTWKLPESSGSFFYECALKPEGATLPWSFDVSYKLNGVPTDAENLAGASGMVEISVKAVPNRNVSDYYKNNMLLQAGTMIDMEDTLSIEAPGAQVQTVGKSKLVMFAALPGEETTFNMRIGTKKFETDGLVLMMVPGSLDQMKDIKDLKEDKDTMEDSVDAIHDSTNVILGTIESMSVGLKRTQSGLSALDRARGTISSKKDGLYNKADLSLADLTAVAQQTALLVPHLQSAQQMVKDVNGDLNALTKIVGEAKPYLASLNSSIGRIQDDVKDLREVLDNIDNTSSDRNEVLGDMRKDIESARAGLTALQPLLTDLSKNLGELSALLEQLQQALGETDPANAALFASLKKVADSTNSLVYAMGLACGQADEYLDTADKTVDLADDYFDALDDATDTASSMLKHSNQLGDSAQSLLRLGETLIDQTTDLNSTMNRYEPETVSALKDTEELTRRLTSALNSSNAFLSSFESTIKASDGNLDAGSRDSLNGMIGVLGKSLDGISRTSVIKKANNTIKDAIDKETDKYEDDSNLLNLDAEAKPVSFTSEKNASPESIQIILRTEEISAGDEEESTEDLEKEKEKMNPFQRMLNVFQKIWQSVIDAFTE